ncbi:hypothetical protein IQ235_17580 [Oscillatoriales cyanobacterium LEGE 11467]|uniref:Uncharacterized protein n=1 Tax=Zarconia navalis LEGE 11467 TaxID=1828826 RepID=A0A928W277_9CYAN|nr:hypothetical protein [Zarconia navalis]MBE9042583.1 hypothetical protein [Zarconia navalis LEGE 11467]
MPSNDESKTYSNKLRPWAIARLLPNMQQEIVARFRTQSDANGHRSCLSRQIPQDRYVVFFDHQPQPTPPASPEPTVGV